MKQNIRLRLLSYGVIVYLLMAFAWWTILLFTKNRDAFQAKEEFLKLVVAAEGNVKSEEAFYQLDRYQELKRKYIGQEWMILGEAIVFVISLVIGVWLINRGYNKEVMAAQQRRNFLLSITHELKSPLASIRLVLETFLKRELPKAQMDKLSQTGIKETERLNTLVNDLLLSARLETAYKPVPEDILLPDLIREIISKLEDKYPKATFRLKEQSAIGTYMGDRLGMTSVVLNLLENAVKYSNDPPVIEARLSQSNGKIQLEVADQGIGIPDKEKKNIFEKFYRVGSEDTRKTKGTGLGLYIVSEIVKAHKGHIAVYDNEPKGTIFSISLPNVSQNAKTPTD